MAREYKDSGIEWIGQIPKEWEVKLKISISGNQNVSIIRRCPIIASMIQSDRISFEMQGSIMDSYVENSFNNYEEL